MTTEEQIKEKKKKERKLVSKSKIFHNISVCLCVLQLDFVAGLQCFCTNNVKVIDENI